MNVDKVFVDTNILFYAYDLSAGKKHLKAKDLIVSLWEEESNAIISIQVLQELYVNLIKHKINSNTVSEIIYSYLSWNVIENTKELLIESIKIQQKNKLSFWDASIISAAIKGGAKLIYSEDFNHGQNFQGVKVVNPFAISN